MQKSKWQILLLSEAKKAIPRKLVRPASSQIWRSEWAGIRELQEKVIATIDQLADLETLRLAWVEQVSAHPQQWPVVHWRPRVDLSMEAFGIERFVGGVAHGPVELKKQVFFERHAQPLLAGVGFRHQDDGAQLWLLGMGRAGWRGNLHALLLLNGRGELPLLNSVEHAQLRLRAQELNKERLKFGFLPWEQEHEARQTRLAIARELSGPGSCGVQKHDTRTPHKATSRALVVSDKPEKVAPIPVLWSPTLNPTTLQQEVAHTEVSQQQQQQQQQKEEGESTEKRGARRL